MLVWAGRGGADLDVPGGKEGDAREGAPVVVHKDLRSICSMMHNTHAKNTGVPEGMRAVVLLVSVCVFILVSF